MIFGVGTDIVLIRRIKNSKCRDIMAACRSKVHQWDKVNRMIFDAGKEHIIVIHPVQGEGDPFKLLGSLVDCKLVMQQAVEKMMSQIRPKFLLVIRWHPVRILTIFQVHSYLLLILLMI